jgi:hypothetical protein
MPETAKVVDMFRASPLGVNHGWRMTEGRTVEWGEGAPDAQPQPLPRIQREKR